MSDIKITYESLYEILRKEKNSEELQKLSPNFFDEVIEYMNTKKEILKSQESKDSIFTQSEALKTRKQIEQIQKILKELYERRENKIMQLALFSSRTDSDMKDFSILDYETELYNDLKSSLTKHRNSLFNRLMNGKKEEPKVLKSQDDKISLKLVKITKPIPKFVGDDMQIYGPFEQNDIVSISEEVANLLLKNNRAEEIKDENT